MTIQEYIASGILEVYASGGLSGAEREEVELMVQQHPEVRAEVEQIEAALEEYALMNAEDPPADLKAKILTSLPNAELNTDTKPLPAPAVVPFTPSVDSTKNQEPSRSWFAAAAVILLLLSAGLNYYFYHNWQQAENKLTLAVNERQEFARNFEKASLGVQETEALAEVLQNPTTRRLALQGQAKSPEAEAVVFCNPKTKMVWLAVKKLPLAPAGKQYQLWALKDGNPVNAGLYDPNDAILGLQQMKDVMEADAFALTLEPQGGSENPTLDEMYLMGKM